MRRLAASTAHRARWARCLTRVSLVCVALASLSLTVAGCASFTDAGALAVSQQPEPGPRLVGDFDQLRYRIDGPGEATFVFTAGPPDTAGQAAVVRLYWTPSAGDTALSSQGTNCSIQYLVFADAVTDRGLLREVGVYHGAGFLFLEDEPGPAQLTGAMRDATLALSDRSDRFRDLLRRSRMTGAFTAELDAPGVASALADLNRRVNARLGYPRLIDAPGIQPGMHPGLRPQAAPPWASPDNRYARTDDFTRTPGRLPAGS